MSYKQNNEVCWKKETFLILQPTDSLLECVLACKLCHKISSTEDFAEWTHMYAAKEAQIWKLTRLQGAINYLVVLGCEFKALIGVCKSVQLAFVCHFPSTLISRL